MNYKKLVEDKLNGNLSDNAILVMDNDGGYWEWDDDSLSDDEREIRTKSLEETYGTPNGYNDIVDVINAIGIRSEWC